MVAIKLVYTHWDFILRINYTVLFMRPQSEHSFLMKSKSMMCVVIRCLILLVYYGLKKYMHFLSDLLLILGSSVTYKLKVAWPGGSVG